jgi:hypothetical protein
LEKQRLTAGGSNLVHVNAENLRRRVWLAALEGAKPARRDLYATRHTFATHALASGEDPGWGGAHALVRSILMVVCPTYYRYIPDLTRKDGSLLAKRLVANRPSRSKRRSAISRHLHRPRYGAGAISPSPVISQTVWTPRTFASFTCLTCRGMV